MQERDVSLDDLRHAVECAERIESYQPDRSRGEPRRTTHWRVWGEDLGGDKLGVGVDLIAADFGDQVMVVTVL